MTTYGVWKNIDDGVSRKIHPPGKNVMMAEVKFAAGAAGAAHSHPHEQLTYCLQGKLEFTVGSRKIILLPGESLVIPGGTIHGAIALEPSILIDIFTPLREDMLTEAGKGEA
ncbi:Cupin domain-containing protein [Evansella caseinilytica]|uniref:Cupin domain-containing protein n=1 Tax=Evansella caseinilytica TaxID=1503961 RepID=A0A1H3NY28_9BACI|nr:cupin domain-containing protein [Evansella caseinilytica]SDY93718.1 Cupin domain-containing protein [Evansella caseinilytica]